MRNYDHGADEELVEHTLERFLRRSRPRIWRQITEKSPDLNYLARTALPRHYEAACAAWGLEDYAVLGELRGLVSDITGAILARFTPEEIHARMGFFELCMASVGADAPVLSALASAFVGRPHVDPEHITTAECSHDLAEAFSALVIGDDVVARAAAQRAADGLRSPAMPPGTAWFPLPAAINAVIDHDEAELALAAAESNERHVVLAAPTSERRAGAQSVVNVSLSFACRLARWREMTPPESPYILAMDP